MRFRGRFSSNQRGAVMITVVILLLTIAVIGATLLELSSAVDISARIMVDQTKALYLAEGGISAAVAYLKSKTGSSEEEVALGPLPLGEGTYSVKINLAQSLITSTGEVHGTRKKLQMQFSSL